MELDTRYWTYRMEWKPGPDGYISWLYDGEFVWGMNSASFQAYEVCAKTGSGEDCHRTPPRMIPQEPMSLVMNTAIGTWNGGKTAIDGLHWPAAFFVDYVRVWQQEAEISVGCNPPDFPTKDYIEKHKEWYGEWSTPTGYETCPEIYPKSAYDNAAAIKARGAKLTRLSAANVELTATHFGAEAKAQVLTTQGHGLTATLLAPVGLLAAVGVAAGFLRRRGSYAPFEPSGVSGVTEPLAEGEYEGEYELARDAQ